MVLKYFTISVASLVRLTYILQGRFTRIFFTLALCKFDSVKHYMPKPRQCVVCTVCSCLLVSQTMPGFQKTLHVQCAEMPTSLLRDLYARITQVYEVREERSITM